MPNDTVPASAGGMPRFNRGAVMRKAWELYRSRHCHLKFLGFMRDGFRKALRDAWAMARKAAAVAAMTVEARKARVAELIRSIDELQYKSFRYDISGERLRYSEELAFIDAINNSRPALLAA